MNINQIRLTHKEQELMEKVLNFPLQVNTTTICFKDIADIIELDLSVPTNFIDEQIDTSSLEKRKGEIEADIQKWKALYQNWFHKTEEERQSISATWPWRENYPHHDLGDYIGMLKDRHEAIKNILVSDGIVHTPLLGSFIPQEKKVYLYLDNIKDIAKQNWRDRADFLILTFIHEMFHAWNYFASGCNYRTVREIDEPMVEFGTLYFLKKIALSDSVFDKILICAENNIRKKQNALGSLAAYGFGYYLYVPHHAYEEKTALQMLEVYGKKSGSIQITKEAIQVKASLCPFYPFDKESQILELFYIIIVQGGTVLNGWLLEVFEYVNKIHSNIFRLDDIYVFADEIQKKHPNNQNIRAKIRQQLQILCDKGLIQRITNGNYSK